MKQSLTPSVVTIIRLGIAGGYPLKSKIMRRVGITLIPLFGMLLISQICLAQSSSTSGVQDEIIALEKKFAEVIKSRDSIQASQLQSESYFLAIGIQGMPIQNIPKVQWLSTLRFYVTESYSIDDIKVNVYGNTAVAM